MYYNNIYMYCLQLHVRTRIIKGFYDDEGTKEFLFALPRFARDEASDIIYLNCYCKINFSQIVLMKKERVT